MNGSFNLEYFPFLGEAIQSILFGCLLELDGFGTGFPDIIADVQKTAVLFCKSGSGLSEGDVRTCC